MGIDEPKLMKMTVLQDILAEQSRALEAGLAVRNSIIDAGKVFREKSGFQVILEGIKGYETLMRSAAGPLAEMQRAGIFDRTFLVSPELDIVRRAMSDWEARFRLPEIAEAARLVADFHKSAASEALKRYAEHDFGFQRAMESMRTPWLDAQESLRSMSGFAALQGMGHALAHMPAFGEYLGSALRIDLGDWRDTIIWPKEIFTDLSARADFYVKLGFDAAITDFPAPAFRESLDIADLRREPPPLVESYGPPVPTFDDDEEEESLVRTNLAHDWLLRLETQVRKFIDELMTSSFGRDWPKHRLPNGLYDEWQGKMQKAHQNGAEERALIAYADFTDYERVICKRDNWSIFAPFFGRQESVRESFQRLYPVRLDTMHARPITQDDELLLYVEARRLVKVIIMKKP
jgi:hypothetical protein